MIKFSIMYGSFTVPEPVHHGWVSAQVQLCAFTPVAVPLIKNGACETELSRWLTGDF